MSYNRSFLIDEPEILDSPEEVMATLGKDGRRKWVYPTLSLGKHHKRRKLFGWALIVLFVALPIIQINGKPAVLIDFVHREFALFGLLLYPTDTLLLLLLMISTVLGVGLFTALLGRVWCGWACPQTVYLEFVFRPIEKWIEGKEHIQRRRDAGPWNWDKIWRKSLKFLIYLAISLALAHVFISYFLGWSNLIDWIQRPPQENWGFFVMMAGTTGLILYDFGYFREQMCTIACPYARMQSVLLDEDSMIVSYDPNRGEPRKKRSKKIIAKELAGEVPAQGDCIDCFACVRTCPTGIDIRDGLQMECIACAQCIDACDVIMEKIDKPKGLIRYTSENELLGKSTHKIRPRTLVYSALMLSVAVALVAMVFSRGAFDINVGRSVGEPFTVLPDGRIANRLRFRVRNQQQQATAFSITTIQPADTKVQVIGASPVQLAPEEMKRVEAWIVIPADAFTGDSIEATFELLFDNGMREMVPFTLLGPSADAPATQTSEAS
ncbi:MAG: cytochrome c oxidase accessory protein CcoG [Bacteroidota bacterium]